MSRRGSAAAGVGPSGGPAHVDAWTEAGEAAGALVAALATAPCSSCSWAVTVASRSTACSHSTSTATLGFVTLGFVTLGFVTLGFVTLGFVTLGFGWPAWRADGSRASSREIASRLEHVRSCGEGSGKTP